MYNIVMKKKFNQAILCVFVALCMFCLQGCFGYDPTTEEPTNYSGLDYVMALYHQSNYFDDDITNIVGEDGDKAYLNKYAHEIMLHLYAFYGNYSSVGLTFEAKKYNDIKTDTSYTENEFMFDTIRYSFKTATDSAYTIDTDAGWNWKISYTNADYPSFAGQYGTSGDSLSSLTTFYNDFTSYLTAYAGNDEDGDGEYAGDFVWGMEYIITKTVLGYDKNDIADDFVATDGSLSINGTTAQSAIETVRTEYKNSALYIGVTDENLEQISALILEVVIGREAYAYNSLTLNGTSVNRDYDNIVSNIVSQTASLVSIGNDSLVLSSPYLASYINTYYGDGYFVSAASQEDSFEYITPHEYQSALIVAESNIELSEMWLCFQYYNYNNVSNFLDKLKINVKVLYHSAVDKATEEIASGSIEIASGLCTNPDNSTLVFVTEETKNGEPNAYQNACVFSTDPVIYSFGEDFSSLKGENNTAIKISGTKIPLIRNLYKFENKDGNVLGRVNENILYVPYFEIVFEIDKSEVSNKNACYDFQFGFFILG